MKKFRQWLDEVRLFRSTASEKDGALPHYGTKSIVRDFHNDFPSNRSNRVKAAEVDLGNVHDLGKHDVYGNDHSAEGLAGVLHRDGILSHDDHKQIIGKGKGNSESVQKRLVQKLKDKQIHSLRYKYPWSSKKDNRPQEDAYILTDPSSQIKKSRTSQPYARVKLKEEEDYKGQHQAPDAEGGSPMHDVTKNGTYPKDFYDHVGFKYYSYQGGKHDSTVHYIVTSKKGHPNHLVTVYRAIPKHVKGKEAKINKGDWVTPHPAYAHEHGKAHLGGKGTYRVVKSVVHARDLHTDGNSIHEWGYDPQPYDKEADRVKWARIAAKKATP